MDERVAQIVIIVIGGIGVLAWLIAVRCYKHLGQLSETVTTQDQIKGVSVEGALKSILKLLANNPAIEITNRMDNAVSFRIQKVDVAARLSGDSSGVQLETLVDPAPLLRGFRIGMFILVFIVEPAVILLLATLLWTLVAPANDLAVRWQVVQMVQIIHVLWPPFLIYGLARGFRTIGVRFAERLPLQVEIADA